MTAAKPKPPKSDTSRAPWPAIPGIKDIKASPAPGKRPYIPIEQLSLVDDPVPDGRMPQGSRYSELFRGALEQGKMIKVPPGTAPSVVSMLRHWLARQGIKGYSPRSMSVYDASDKTGRVWLVKAGAATPTKSLPQSSAARAGQQGKKGATA